MLQELGPAEVAVRPGQQLPVPLGPADAPCPPRDWHELFLLDSRLQHTFLGLIWCEGDWGLGSGLLWAVGAPGTGKRVFLQVTLPRLRLRRSAFLSA